MTVTISPQIKSQIPERVQTFGGVQSVAKKEILNICVARCCREGVSEEGL